MTDYTNQENFCEQQFRSAGPYWHLCTEENFPIIFESADHFKQGMSVLAYCTLISQGIKLLTFALMSNHLHIVLSGAHSAVENYFQTLKGRLAKINCSVSHRLDDWQKQIIPIDNLESLRNAIAYVNRNGYVASTTYTPFSYPWGTNNLFFNNEMKAFCNQIGKEMSSIKKREVTHCRNADRAKGILEINGYASAICFCDIDFAETLFRNARHYFTKLTKNIESLKSVEDITAHRALYSDEELSMIANSLAKKEYGESLHLLPSTSKLELARKLHYDYYARNKQLVRILRIDIGIIDSLFPAP